MTDARVWIYALVDPRTEEYRYIGLTARPTKRLGEHIREARAGGGTHRLRWIREVLDAGFVPKFELIEDFEPEDAERKEVAIIKVYRLVGERLTNSTEGGSGVRNPSAETRAKWSKAFKGRPFSEEHLKNLRAASALRRGIKQGLETRAKKSAAHKLRGTIPPIALRRREQKELDQ